MKCPECKAELKEVRVKVHGAKQKVASHQCPRCEYFAFEPESATQVLQELRETPLRIEQRIIKLSGERLGLYLSKHIVQSLGLKKGESVYLSVPDKRHILIELG